MTYKSLALSSAVGLASSLSASADVHFNSLAYSMSGNIFVFDAIPHVGWLVGEILPEDYFHLRRMLREHEIHTLILDSNGGDLYESLYMAAVIHDRQINTYVPATAFCESACANMFFAGASRLSNGDLGVHQFSTGQQQENEGDTQLKVSDVISFLNEFDTPPVVYERMFESPELYYFSEMEKKIINRYADGDDIFVRSDFYDATFDLVYEELYSALIEDHED